MDIENKQIYLYITIDNETKVAYTEFHSDQTEDKTIQFIRRLKDSAPYQIRSIVTEGGIDWTNRSISKSSFNRVFKRINK